MQQYDSISVKEIKEIIKDKDDNTILLTAYKGKDKNVIIPDNVSVIMDNAFLRCEHLKSVVIPESVAIIGERTFSYCESLKSIKIPDKVKEIGVGAFRYCRSLEEINISESTLNTLNMTNEQFAKHIGINVDALNVIENSKGIEKE